MLENLSDVRIFVQVMESGGLTAAGHVLRLPTNQVSRRLTRLEGALGARLFNRTTRKVTATEEGKGFYLRALRLLESAREAEEILGRSSALEGSVRVAVRTTSVEFGFVTELSRVLLAHEGLSVQLMVRDEPVDLVGSGVDLGVLIGSLADSSAVARPVGEARYVLAASRAYARRNGLPRTPADLVQHQVIRRHGATPEVELTLLGPRKEEVTVPIVGRLECSDSRAQAIALHEGLGIALRPAGEVRAAEADGRLVRALPEWHCPPVPVWAVSPPGRSKLARVALLIEALRKVVRALA
jgi:DNA-binding transcriptional LysR family regulator